MIFELLRHKPGCHRLVLIFTGWSTTPELYQDLSIEGWDIGVVHDYADLSLDARILDSYSTIWLFAWSLGIVAAAHALPAEKISAAFAINGTLNPADDYEGIPTAIYEGTIANLDQKNLSKFLRRMSPDSDTFKRLFDKPFSDNLIESLRNQLTLLQELPGSNINKLPWRKVFISRNDRIFPLENMRRSWCNLSVEIVELDGAHYYPIDKIIKSVIPDKHRIASNFSSTLESYDHNALAQERMVNRLVEMLRLHYYSYGGKMLEIGPGSGMFTRKYAEIFQPSEIDFIELFPISPFRFAPEESYLCGDAEELIRTIDKKYDLILSSSAIQWFTNIPEFIKECKKHLNPGGILAISSFVKGNLSELDAFRPSPLHYLTEKEYQMSLSGEFSDYLTETCEVTLNFRSKRELLMHLKHTGVTAAGNISTSPLSLPETLTTLTYRPILIIAKI